MTDRILATNVSKTYSDGTRALTGIDIDIQKGQFYGLMGRNGAGKTTLIDILTGQKQPDTGNIDVMGVDPTKNPTKVRSMVGILPEKESPIGVLTPQEQFEFVGNAHNVDRNKIDERIEFWSEKLNLEDKMNKKNKTLSRGQQQKVMFASTFIHEPDLVFIDEPLANLDPPIQRKLKQYLKNYNEEGNTVVLSTHYVEAALELCSRILIVDGGTAVEEKDTKNIGSPEYIEQMLR